MFPSSAIIPSATAQELKSLVEEQADDQPWSISADSISFDPDASLYTGNGHVVISKGATRLTAEMVTFDPNAMLAEAQGDVTLTTATDQMSCRRIELDLKKETGTLYDGSIFLSEGHFYLRGDKIEKTGDASYSADKATITTCDGEHPDWKITARKLNITVEGYGTAAHTTLWAKSLPVFYSPFLAFPVKIKRQTGLLAPRMGSSNRKGITFEQPFFWAIGDSSDMTLNYNYMAKRGNQYGLEYRYFLTEDAKGMLMFDWLDDAHIDDGQGDNSKDWGYEDDKYLRPNEERYWLRMKHDQPLGAGYKAKLDLDIVSDQDYLPEFKNTLTGFKLSQDAFGEFMGRNLDDYTDITRRNTVNISKTWTHYNLNAGAYWTDHTANRNLDLSNPTVQYLPSISFEGSKHRLYDSPLYLSLNSQYAYLYREDRLSEIYKDTGAHRLDLSPRVYLPFNLGYYLSVEPSAGVRETIWQTTDRQTRTTDTQAEDEENEFKKRQLWDARLMLSNLFYRIYKPRIGEIDRIKHDIKPEVVYQYIPGVDQDDLPHFDAVDRIASQSLVTYSVTNTLTYRRQPAPLTAAEEKNPAVPLPAPQYRQFARFKIGQSYDLTDGNDPYKGLRYRDGEIKPNAYVSDYPFSEIFAELELTPLNYFSIDTDAKWSLYDKEFRTGNLALNLWDHRQDRLRLEYRYAQRIKLGLDETDEASFYTAANIRLTDRLDLFGSWERDLHADTELEYGGGFLYASQCWSFEAAHTVEGRDHRYSFVINLYGVGKMGF